MEYRTEHGHAGTRSNDAHSRQDSHTLESDAVVIVIAAAGLVWAIKEMSGGMTALDAAMEARR